MPRWPSHLDDPGRRARGGRGRACGARRPRTAACGRRHARRFAIRVTDGYAAAAPTLTRALDLLLALDLTNDESRRSHLARRRTAQHHRSPRAVGCGSLSCAGRSPGTARPRRGRARAPPARAQFSCQKPRRRRRADHGVAVARRGSLDRRGDWEPGPGDCRDAARGLARPGDAGVGADRGHRRGGRRTRCGHEQLLTRARCFTTAWVATTPRSMPRGSLLDRDPVGYGPLVPPGAGRGSIQDR